MTADRKALAGPERIWINRCHPCTEPDDYYVQHPDYTGFASIGYIRADLHDEVRCRLASAMDDLEAYVRAEYGWPDVHPANKARFDRDMVEIVEGRAALARTGEG